MNVRAPDAQSLHAEAVRAITRGDDARALALYRAAADRDPRNPMHALRVADCLVRLGRVEDALATYRQVADRYAADGQFARATSVSRIIVRLAPRDRVAADRLANLQRSRAASAERLANLRNAAVTTGAMPDPAASNAAEVVPPEVAELFPVVELEPPPAPQPDVAALEASVRSLLAELLRTQTELAAVRARAGLAESDAAWSID